MGSLVIGLGADRAIGLDKRALVVAEIGQNHNGRLSLAEQLVDAAAWAGVDAVKLVKRDLDCELSREAARQRYSGPKAFGPTYGEHRRALELSAEEHRTLCRRIRARGLALIYTACDVPSAKLALELQTDGLKVASRDVAQLPLIEFLGSTGRPVFLSTGMSDLSEIDAAVSVLREAASPMVLLQCTSLYPTPMAQAHLRSMATLASRYESLVGFSDHTLGSLLAPVAVAMGARVIEKHMTLDRQMKGTDHACSLEPEEFSRMIADIRQVETALGSREKPVSREVEDVRRKLGRSLVTRWPLAAGTRIEESMLTLKCPGDGIGWAEREGVLGLKLKRDLPANVKLNLSDVT